MMLTGSALDIRKPRSQFVTDARSGVALMLLMSGKSLVQDDQSVAPQS